MKTSRFPLISGLVVLALVAIESAAQFASEPYTFTTLAGDRGHGSADGVGNNARFYFPHGVAVDGAGNVYVADTENCTIRKMTPAGVVTTLAGLAQLDENGNPATGSVDGIGSAARFSYPRGVAVDGAGNVYVADSGNNTIRKITPAGVVSTLAGLAQLDENGNPVAGSVDGIGSAARFSYPGGVAVDSAGNVCVADSGNNTIRKITPAGVVTTLAGLAGTSGSTDGPGTDARFFVPSGVTVDSFGYVFVADTFNYTIRKITPTGIVSTLAGKAGQYGGADGVGSDARFGTEIGMAATGGPAGVALDKIGNVYVVDSGRCTIQKVSPAGVVTTVAGHGLGNADGQGSDARFGGAAGGTHGIALDNTGNIYVADTGNHSVRKVTLTGAVTILAGVGSLGNRDGTGILARFFHPAGVAVDSAGNAYVADTGNNTIRKMTRAGVVTTLAGLAGSSGSVDGAGSAARFIGPRDMAVDSGGNIYVVDSGTIRRITPAGVVTTMAGVPFQDQGTSDGTGSTARFEAPVGITTDNRGNIYIAESSATQGRIRKMTPAGVVSTMFGRYFASPTGVALDGAGNFYVVESEGGTLWKVTATGVATVFAKVPVARSGLAIDSAGNIYLAANSSVYKVTAAGAVTTIAGGKRVGLDGTGRDAGFGTAFIESAAVGVDSGGTVYTADTGNNTIRIGYPATTIHNSGQGFGFNGSQFGFVLTGQVGRLVVVEVSRDLIAWQPVWTNTFAGPLTFTDTQSSTLPNRFYRVH